MRSIRLAAVALATCSAVAACGGGGSAAAPGSQGAGASGGGGGATTFSFAQFCGDLNSDSVVVQALASMPVTADQPPQESSADLNAAATKAAALASEAAPGPGPGLLSKIDIKATLTGISNELTAAAAKVANGDTGGYAVNGDLQTHLIAVGTVCLQEFPTSAGAPIASSAAAAGTVPPSAAPVAPSATPAASELPSAAPATSGEAGSPAGSAPQQSAVATAVNPCDLVTAAEAAKLAGASLGAGTQGSGDNGMRTCTYAIPRPWDVMWVVVAQAPDAATAQAGWAQEEAQQEQAAAGAEPGGGPTWTLAVSDVAVPGADKGAAGSASVLWPAAKGKIQASALYALKGAVFVGISDVVAACPIINVCGLQPMSAPTAEALQAEMATALGRLP